MALRPAAELEGRIPMKRLGSFAELAAVVEFLGSPAAGYISGTVVRVDGGWGAYSWMYPVRTL
jgi:NAD(P)-dependent dehydrogenase (short-subunit alcohol dehydrogenase family)